MLEKERSTEIQRFKESIQDREFEIQRLITERDSILQQNRSDEVDPEVEEEMSRLRSQIDSLQKGVNEERENHEQVLQELTGSLQQERRANEDLKSDLVESREKFEEKIKHLKTEVATKHDQLTELSARNDLLNSAIETLKSEQNVKKLEEDVKNFQDVSLQMESMLKVNYISNVFNKKHTLHFSVFLHSIRSVSYSIKTKYGTWNVFSINLFSNCLFSFLVC